MNNRIGPYIKNFKGVRQGDPLSPLLFNFVADCLARMVTRNQTNGLIQGLVSHVSPNGVLLLQYADETILCLKHDISGAMHLKLLLYLYEMLSGQKINFTKREVTVINGDDEIRTMYAEIFNCQISNRLAAWKGNPLSIAGRVVLINSCLTSSPIYHMSLYLLHKQW
jgi:hypothetical protein